MEAVELTLPATVAQVSKILTVEGFGREGVSAETRESRAKDPVFGRFPGTRCSTFSTDMTSKSTASDQNSVLRNKKADAGLCMFHTSLPSYVEETTVPQDAKLLFTAKQLQRKAGKAPKHSSFSSRRPRSDYVQGSMSQAVSGDCNVLPGKHKSGLTECAFAERSLVIGQKHSLDGKRGDKRNFKLPTKTRVEPSFSKTGLANSISSAGGGSILGIYGLKSDIHDVTKHVDELSLNDLLDGSYKYPSLCQDKGKKAANTNENLVHTIKKACSILQPWKPVQSQNGAELDSSSNRKMDPYLLSSSSSVASGTDCTEGDICMADLASSSKETCTESTTSALCQPKDILERLALPPSKNLDALILDTSKPALSRSINDLRLSKPMSYEPSLPPFPWSHCSTGPSKTTIDAGRLCCNRTRWVRIGSISSSLGDAPSFMNLDSETFGHKNSVKCSDWLMKLGLPVENLPRAPKTEGELDNPELALPQRSQGSFDWQMKLGLPVENLPRAPKTEGELDHPENLVSMDPSLNHQFPEKGSGHIELDQSKRQSNGDSASTSHYSLPKSSVRGLDQSPWQSHTSEKSIHAGHSPRLLAAAQTLYEIARHSTAENLNDKLRWPKRPSQKAMKARKPRSTGKTEVLSSKPRLELEHCDQVEIMDTAFPSKKPKYSINNISHTNHVRKGPMKWSIPTSSRSPPSRSENVEAKLSNSDSVRLSMMPSFKRGLDKVCDSELRKSVPMDWGRGRSKNEC